MIKIIDSSECPEWLEYPEIYLRLVYEDKNEFLPWYLYDAENIKIRWKGLQERYPKRHLFPFARTDNSDDIACWEKEKPGKVQIIHDFASEGWEQKKEFNSFEEWYDFVLSERWPRKEYEKSKLNKFTLYNNLNKKRN